MLYDNRNGTADKFVQAMSTIFGDNHEDNKEKDGPIKGKYCDKKSFWN